MGWVLMSEREVHRVEVLSSVVARRMSTSEAASVLCLSDRQVQRLLKTFREDGAVALRHKARGRPSNNRSLEGLRDLTLSIVRERSFWSTGLMSSSPSAGSAQVNTGLSRLRANGASRVLLMQRA